MPELEYSIIIPIYNAEKTLCRCIDSIININRENIEIILVNDGSTDSSLSICKHYSQNYDKIVTIDKENGGAASARNAGLSIATGKYIVFVDSDDYILNSYFSTLDEVGDVDLVIFGMLEDDGRKVIERDLDDRYDEYDGTYYIVKSRNGGPWNKRFKRDLIKKTDLQFPVDFAVGEDTIFCLKYSLVSSDTVYIHKPLYYYDTSIVGSLTRKYRPNYVEESQLFYNYCFNIVNGFLNENKQTILMLLDYNYCRSAFVSATVPIKYNIDIKSEYAYMLNEYSSNLHKDLRARGLIHKAMRFCIRKKLKPIFLIVARVVCFIQTKIK